MRYVLVASRDPFESREALHFCELAASLASHGERVTLFLVQNGVLAGRESVAGDPLRHAVDAGVEVVADAFSLRERGVGEKERHPAIGAIDMSGFVDRVTEGPSKVLWQ